MQEQLERGGGNPMPSPWTKQPHILVVDDEPDACEAMRQVLMSEGYDATPESSAQRALQRIATEDFDLVMSDVSMSEMDGLDLCRRVGATKPDLPVILVTGRGTMNTAVGALRSGARDFLTKPVDVDSLIVSVVRALQRHVPKGRDSTPPPDASTAALDPSSASLLGQSAAMRGLRRLIGELSSSSASVVIQGETGTGKELVARAIHASSRFRGGPFIALNCAAVPPGLLEAELFGHARGAFTDAKTARTGLFVEANGGTLLLDEVNELPLEMQPKLLRVLQERRVRPVGEHREIPFDCRIIAATNQDLDAEVAARRFREDLYFRLDVVRLNVPPLRERGEDVLLLARHFLATVAQGAGRHATLSAAAAKALMAYDWPGNVRELENCIERAMALSQSDQLGVEDLSERVRAFEPMARDGSKSAAVPAVASLFELERRHTLKAIELLSGNMTRAAKLLGIDRTTLYRRLKRYETAEPS